MSNNGRNFVKDEIEAAYRQIPSFKDNAIDAMDIEQFFKIIGFYPTPEKVAEYHRWWNNLFNGKAPLDVMTGCMVIQNDTLGLLRHCVVAADKDKDGFIDEDEFKVVAGMVLTHDPDFPRVDFAKFVEEADTNKDGKVSVEEALAWFTKVIPL